MHVYTVYRPLHWLADDTAADGLRSVRDGFSWPAFLFPLPWLLFKRLWLPALVMLAVSGGLMWLGLQALLSQPVVAGLSLMSNLIVGFEAGTLLRWQARREGLVEVADVLAASTDAALHRYLDTRSAPAVASQP